jgi:hypothetical protein
MLATILFSLLATHPLSRNINAEIYKAIILSVALYGCAIWSLTLMEQHRLKVFENRVLKRIFEPRSEE